MPWNTPHQIPTQKLSVNRGQKGQPLATTNLTPGKRGRKVDLVAGQGGQARKWRRPVGVTEEELRELRTVGVIRTSQSAR